MTWKTSHNSSTIKTSKTLAEELHMTIITRVSLAGRDIQLWQWESKLLFLPVLPHSTTMCRCMCMVCIVGWAAPSLRRAENMGGFSREIFPCPKRMEGPHVFRKQRLPVSIHQDCALQSTATASQLYKPQTQIVSFSQCFPRGFWWESYWM